MPIKIKYLTHLILFLIISCSPKEHELYSQKPAFYSYVIGDVNKEQASTAYNQDVYIIPASCQKTITALVAYKDLGSEYVYQTKVYVTKKKDEIENVIIKFSGDPSLTSEKLSNLLEPLKHYNIKGRIIIDASKFKTPPFSNNNIIDDIGRGYSPPVSSANLDGNLINVAIIFDKLTQQIMVKNDAEYLVEKDIKISSEETSIKFEWQGNTIKASGNIKFNQEPLTFKLSPPDIDFYLLKKIKKILKAEDIKGQLVVIKESSKIPSNGELLLESTSQPLKKIIPPALKKSDNMVFDSLYLTIINNYDQFNNLGGIKEWKEGDAIMKLLVKKYFDVDMEDTLIVDGSGLSRYNRIKTKTLFTLIKKGYSVKEFVDALPKPSETDTSLEKRNSLLSTIRAKTGTMSGVSCLCGYNINGKSVKAFTVIANSFNPPLRDIFKVQDQFINSQVK